MADIFISYERSAESTAETLANALSQHGWSVWWDKTLRTGDKYTKVIDRELRNARCVIVLWSSAAEESGWVRDEAQYAYERGVLLPATLDQAPLPLGFRTIQTVDLYGWNGNYSHAGFKKLCEDIQACLKQPQQNTLPDSPEQINPHPTDVVDIVHPYRLQANFAGRIRERQQLSNWYCGNQSWVLVIEAIGGMGKSALAWTWLQAELLQKNLNNVQPITNVTALEKPEIVIWWSFYEPAARFSNFIDYMLKCYSDSTVYNLKYTENAQHEKIKAVLRLLKNKRFLIVFDGFERELDCYAELASVYQGDTLPEKSTTLRKCYDADTGKFMRWLVSEPLPSRICLTSRLVPEELSHVAGVKTLELTGLSADDAAHFFRSFGIRANRAEVDLACEPYGYHPLVIRLLVGLASTSVLYPNDLRAVKDVLRPESVKAEDQKHHVLEYAYNGLDESSKYLLGRLSAFRSAVDFEVIVKIEKNMTVSEIERVGKNLLQRGLLSFDSQARTFELHPIVRKFAYDRLTHPENVHKVLRDHFVTIPVEQRTFMLSDLEPVIELYHHTLRVGYHEDAWTLFCERLYIELYYRFFEYKLILNLLQALGDKAEKWSFEAAETRSRVAFSQVMADVCSIIGDFKQRLHYQRIAAEMPMMDDTEHAYATAKLGDTMLSLGMIKNAEEFYNNAGHYGILGQSKLFYIIGRPLEALEKVDEGTRYSDKGRYRFLSNLRRAECYLVIDHIPSAFYVCSDAAELFFERNAMGRPSFAQRWWDSIYFNYTVGRVKMRMLKRRMFDELGKKFDELSEEIDIHLESALSECRRLRLIDVEPDVLLCLAEWAQIKQHTEVGQKHLDEALEIVERGGFRLVQADIHNFRAALFLSANDKQGARKEAERAMERAWCDGPPYYYQRAYERAERCLNWVMFG